MAHIGHRYGARLAVSSYNEPLITSEWAVEVFKVVRASGFRTAFVSNGNGTPEVLQYLRPWTEGYKIDLKTMNDRNYRQLGGVLAHVLDTIKQVYALGFWLEIVTLIVPGFNDSEAELREAAAFLASVSPDIPWHVTAFHQDYKMTDRDNTSVRTLIRAAEIGYGAGLHYVYAGNLPGHVGPYENTLCPGCRTTLIRRYGFRILEDRVGPQGICPECDTRLAGIWT
jgi:pyruvate formate lyase activating enzyme